MRRKKHKLRLRKQVIMCIPVLLLIIVLTVGLIIKKNRVYASEVVNESQSEARKEIIDVVKLSDREFFKNLDETLEKRQKDNTIIYYAQKFNLNVDKVLEIAHTLTSNYEDEVFNTTFAIAKPENRENVGPFNSFEAGVVYFIRDIYRYPSRFDTTYEEIHVSDTIRADKTIINKTVYLDSGLTYEQFMGKICDLFGVDKSLALAISYHETGILTSNLFINSNNVGGQRSNSGWLAFDTLESGVISFVLNFKALLENFEIDLTAENGMLELSAVYVYGNKGAGPALSWLDKVTYFQNKINEQDLFTIPE